MGKLPKEAFPEEEENNVSILYELPKKVKKKKRKKISPFVIAGFAAIIIGLFLGILTLQMFVNMTEPASGEINNGPLMMSAPDETILKEVPTLESFMIQAGVFSDVSNAEKWQQDYVVKNFPTILWERNGEWYLFVGIYHSESEAKSEVLKLQAQGIDVFMKQWATNEKQVEITDETDTLLHLQKTWAEALADKDVKKITEATSSLTENDVFKELGHLNISENADQFFLEWMLIYDRIE